MLSVAIVIPVMGARMDQFGAGAALQYVAMLGVILAVIFGSMAAYFATRGGYRPVLLGARHEPGV
jgi:hypothetical protein